MFFATTRALMGGLRGRVMSIRILFRWQPLVGPDVVPGTPVLRADVAVISRVHFFGPSVELIAVVRVALR